MPDPLVSVSLISYNQEKYIAQAIESILSQVTSFDFEIVIGDDGSKDRTKEIIQQYADKDPRIVFLNNSVNVGLQKNITNVFNHCKGKYIALMEGDDYWIDDSKLQIQADFLEAHEDCSLCFTNVIKFKDGNFKGGQLLYVPGADRKLPPEIFDLEYFLANVVSIPNNTKMFRRSAQPDQLPSLFYTSIQWDWLLHLLQGLKGNYGYINRPTLAYRRHPDTLINSRNNERIYLEAIDLVYNVNSLLPEQYWRYFTEPRFEMNSLAIHYLREGKYRLFLHWYRRWLKAENLSTVKWRDQLYLLRKAIF